jgi:hypothetical protein
VLEVVDNEKIWNEDEAKGEAGAKRAKKKGQKIQIGGSMTMR